MLNQGWDDPSWAALYPPRVPRVPGLHAAPGTGVSAPTSDPPEAHDLSLPDVHYTDILRAEAMANPQASATQVTPGIAIGRPDLNANTLL